MAVGMEPVERLVFVVGLSLVGCAHLSSRPHLDADDELVAFLSTARQERRALRVEEERIDEAGGSSVHYRSERRAPTFITLATSSGVEPGRSMVNEWAVTPGWVSREGERLDLTAGESEFVERGLVRGPIALAKNACGAVDLRSKGATVRLCGRLVSEPQLVKRENELVFYGVFDAIGDPDVDHATGAISPQPPLVVPSLRVGAGASTSIARTGPVYFPTTDVADVLVRVVARCSLALDRCSTHSFVSERSSVDAVLVDARRVSVGTGHDVVEIASDESVRVTPVSGWVLGLGRRADGRLNVARSNVELTHFKATGRTPSDTVPLLGALGEDGRFEEGPTLPAPVTGREGSWTWTFADDRFIYGPARTHNLGGAEAPQLVVASVGSAVEAQRVSSSVDAIHSTAEELIVIGASDQGVKTVLRRPRAGTAPWKEFAISPPWSLEHPSTDAAARSVLVEVKGRRLLVVPSNDFAPSPELRVLELTDGAVVDRGSVPKFSPAVPSRAGSLDDWFAVGVSNDRLAVRVSGVLILLDVDGDTVREIERLAL